MKLSKYGFIVKGAGYAVEQRAVLQSQAFATTIIGVDGLESALIAAESLVGQGIQLIELCGGFSLVETEQVRSHIARAIPVGVVHYTADEERELAALFAPDSSG